MPILEKKRKNLIFIYEKQKTVEKGKLKIHLKKLNLWIFKNSHFLRVPEFIWETEKKAATEEEKN